MILQKKKAEFFYNNPNAQNLTNRIEKVREVVDEIILNMTNMEELKLISPSVEYDEDIMQFELLTIGLWE